MALSTRSALTACRSALIHGLVRSAPQAVLDEKGYLSEAGQNLIEGVSLFDFEADLRQGDGNEMEGKFRAAHSSSALAVNTFAYFKSDPAALRLPRGGGFASLSFEPKCPWGLVGEAVKAIVILRQNQPCMEEDLVRYCRERLAAYKVPKSIDFVDSFPLVPTGKVSKKDLRSRYWTGSNRSVA
jgi:acyl-CoA synthetase (AMP-forming)/AMP-acid ligase II